MNKMTVQDSFMAVYKYYQQEHDIVKMEYEMLLIVDTLSLSGNEEGSKILSNYRKKRAAIQEKWIELCKSEMAKLKAVYPYKIILIEQHELAKKEAAKKVKK